MNGYELLFYIPEKARKNEKYREIESIDRNKKIFSQTMEALDKYSEKILENLDNPDSVILEFVKDRKLLANLFRLILSLIENEPALIEYIMEVKKEIYNDLKKKVNKCGMNITEQLEIISEHEIFKLQMMKNRPLKYMLVMIDFFFGNSDERENYVLSYYGAFLMLISLIKTEDCNKIRKIVEHLKRYSDELEIFTLTFMEYMEEADGDSYGEPCKDSDCVKRVLYGI